MVAIAYLCSLGATLRVTRTSSSVPLPASVFQHVPLLDSIVLSRFGAFVDFFAGMALAVVLDRVHAGDFGSLAGPAGRRLHRLRAGARRAALGVVCGAIAVGSVVPLLLLPPWPYPVGRVVEPPILRERALTALPQGSIVREYPPALASDAAPLLWQAVGGITYELSDGYGLVPGAGGQATEQAPVDALSLVFAASALGTLKVPLASSTGTAIRRALVQTHVAAVVVIPGAKGSQLVTSVLTLVLGRPTQRLDGAVMWILPGKPTGPR
jgi:hypothetical protein